MSDIIVDEFKKDLDKIEQQLLIFSKIKKIASFEFDLNNLLISKEESEELLEFHSFCKQGHNTLPINIGVLVLYMCGRFESMSRTIFEDLCQRLAVKAGAFKNLPKKMRENLPIYTAKVISDPRKYGHAEGGVRSFVAILSQNLSSTGDVSSVNHQCLSITDSNMRSGMLQDLFQRVGGNSIWESIANQSRVKVFFEEADVKRVESLAKAELDSVMDLRNKIAHPSGELEWPDIELVRKYLNFFKILAEAIGDTCDVYEVTLCVKEVA